MPESKKLHSTFRAVAVNSNSAHSSPLKLVFSFTRRVHMECLKYQRHLRASRNLTGKFLISHRKEPRTVDSGFRGVEVTLRQDFHRGFHLIIPPMFDTH
jgi:hypothetical protein